MTNVEIGFLLMTVATVLTSLGYVHCWKRSEIYRIECGSLREKLKSTTSIAPLTRPPETESTLYDDPEFTNSSTGSLALGNAMIRASRLLPDGWVINIEVEPDEMTLVLDNISDHVNCDYDDYGGDNFVDTLHNAVNLARVKDPKCRSSEEI